MSKKTFKIDTEWANLFRYSIKEGLEYCRKCLTHENLTFDHLIARSLGGPNTRNNLTILCANCNNAKGQDYLSNLPSLQKVKPIGWIKKPIALVMPGDVTLAGVIVETFVVKQQRNFITTEGAWKNRAGCKMVDGRRPYAWVFVGAEIKELANA